MVDEVDSILLDESNQPLIMGFATDDVLLRSRLKISDKVVTNLRGCPAYYASGEPIPVEIQERYPGDFTTNVIAARKALEFTDAGQEKAVQMLGRLLPPPPISCLLWFTLPPVEGIRPARVHRVHLSPCRVSLGCQWLSELFRQAHLPTRCGTMKSLGGRWFSRASR